MASLQHGRVLHFSTFTVPATTIPTTTYPFTYTTAGYQSAGAEATAPFTTPSLLPTYAPFIARQECCNRWSSTPQDPTGQNASCAISNSACDNPHAFWDLYACCNGAEIKEAGTSGSGAYNGCQATCDAVGQSWQDLMGCLEKRAKVVVCKPDGSEIEGGRSISAASEVASTTTAGSSTPKDASDCSIPMSGGGVHATCVPTNSTGSVIAAHAGAASSIGAMGSSRAGVAIVLIVSLGSIAGMLL